MTLNDVIDLFKKRLASSKSEEDRQLLQWLLELRTMRDQLRQLNQENEALKKEYEKLLLQHKGD